MSPNTPETMTKKSSAVYVGLDIAKATLQLHLQGRQYVLPNSAAGHRKLLMLLRAVPGAHVVCEATGGYERAVVAAPRRRCGRERPEPRARATLRLGPRPPG